MFKRIATVAATVALAAGVVAVGPMSAQAGNGTNDFYSSKNCWAGNKANVQTTNWDVGTGQTYHVWVSRGSGYTGSISMAFDQKTFHSGTGEFYINAPDHKLHTIGVGAAGYGCSYGQ